VNDLSHPSSSLSYVAYSYNKYLRRSSGLTAVDAGHGSGRVAATNIAPPPTPDV